MKPHSETDKSVRPISLKPLSHNHIDPIRLSDGINQNPQRKTDRFLSSFCRGTSAIPPTSASVFYLTETGRVVAETGLVAAEGWSIGEGG